MKDEKVVEVSGAELRVTLTNQVLLIISLPFQIKKSI